MSAKEYRKDFVPLSIYDGYCSLTVALGVLNYFFNVNFGAKDNWDVVGLMKYGRQKKTDLLTLEEMALFFDRLYLDVTLYTGWSKADNENYFMGNDLEKVEIFKKYISEDLYKYIDGTKRVFDNGRTTNIVDNLLDERLNKSDVKYIYQLSKEEIIKDIKKHQNLEEGGVIFVLGVNHSVLYDYTYNPNAGHVVITTGIDENDNFIIHEPLSPRPNPHLIDQDRVLNSIFDTKSYSILMVKENPKHISDL